MIYKETVMNIGDIGSTQTPGSVAATNTAQNRQTGVVTSAPTMQPVVREDAYIPLNGTRPVSGGEESAAAIEARQRDITRADRYIPAPTMPDALYNVSDVKRDENGNVVRNTVSDPSTYHGHRVVDKITEIPLPLGRKNLSIFKLNG
jgi:hypothetical protein